MQNDSHRPWLSLYRGVRPELAPSTDTALEMFRATLARNADAPLVHYFDRSLTAAECDAMSDALAVGLQQRGVEAGDRVAVYLQNVPQVLIAVLAIWKCGAVVVPCNPMLRDRELGKILRSSGCLALICHEDLYADVGKAALPSTAVRHTITTSQLEFLDAEKPCPRCSPASGATGRPRRRTCSRSSRGTPASGRAPSSSRATTSRSWCTRRARRATRRRDEHASQRRVRNLGVRSLDRPDAATSFSVSRRCFTSRASSATSRLRC